MSSATEEKIIRSIDFHQSEDEPPHKEVQFLIDELAGYIQQNFAGRTEISVNETQESFGNRAYTIRKGSGVVDVKTGFGLNTQYLGNQKKSFPTFTIRAAYRNEALDHIENLSQSIESTTKIVVGALFGLLGLAISMFFHGGLYLLLTFVAAGAAVGTGIGSFMGQKLFESKEASLRAQGEIDEMDTEWAQLQETVNILLDERETFRYNTSGTRAWR